MKPRTATILRLLGLAGLAGVAATGVVIARETRQRSQLSAPEIRERLQARYEETRNDEARNDEACHTEVAAALEGDRGHDGR